ncbi:hypothetical protein EDE08_101661 [Bradyrhizobium sp. R2.2-H]|nr:hypothetical protein EDE10_101662 [Bradyrhizobium sp. Y-H1]TCU80961.1 hypothetical protein EDE08_101661 [Bradyrhizobium sp. R2.2-H]
MGWFSKKITCTVHIVSPMGTRDEIMTVGEHIPQEAYKKLKDAAGDMYVLEVFEKGEPTQHILSKEQWLQAKAMMDNA